MQSFHCYMNALLYDCAMCACESQARATEVHVNYSAS